MPEPKFIYHLTTPPDQEPREDEVFVQGNGRVFIFKRDP